MLASCDHSIAMTTPRTFRAGQSVEDFCRACNTDRMHTVVVVDADGRPIRVDCGFCHSEHNYRGGPRVNVGRAAPAESAVARAPRPSSVGEPFPIVSERERRASSMTTSDTGDLERLLRQI